MLTAIVLTYDRNHAITDHMIARYRSVWPSHPLRFRIPYQDSAEWLIDRHGDTIEPVRTPPGIKDTALCLLEGLADDAWVYWCIDDKYPVDMDVAAYDAAARWISEVQDPEIQGLLLCRCGSFLDEVNLRPGSEIVSPAGYAYVERKNYYHCWLHQFVRVGVLRALFSEFPDETFPAKKMDDFTGQSPGLSVKVFDAEQKMYLATSNRVRFGESASAGRITKNCCESMEALGMHIPEHFDRCDRYTIYGRPLQAQNERREPSPKSGPLTGADTCSTTGKRRRGSHMTEAQKQRVGAATASLVLGILGLILIGPLGSVPAIICGHVAKTKIRKEPDALSGDGMALAGLILGYVQIGVMVLLVPILAALLLPAIARAREAAQDRVCVNNMRLIESAVDQAAIEYQGAEGDTIPPEHINEFLAGGGLNSMRCPRSGAYVIRGVGIDPECTVHGSLSEAY